MNDLTISQCYWICAANKNGNISSTSEEEMICFLSAGLYDLKFDGCIEIEDKNITIASDLPSNLEHLRSLYDSIVRTSASKSPLPVKELVNKYVDSDGKLMTKLIGDIVASLSARGLTGEKEGFFKKHIIPDKSVISETIETLKRELSEGSEISEDNACLILLLNASGHLEKYFASDEKKMLRKKLKELKETPEGKEISEMSDEIEDMLLMWASLFSVYFPAE